MRAWILHLLHEKGRNPRTVNVYIAALRFLFTVTLLRPEVMASIRTVRAHHRQPDVPGGSIGRGHPRARPQRPRPRDVHAPLRQWACGSRRCCRSRRRTSTASAWSCTCATRRIATTASSRCRSVPLYECGVSFATKGGRECTLPGVEFLRRFVDHVLPPGFTRIRHYGLLAPCHATTTLERARVLLTPMVTASASLTVTAATTPPTWVERLMALTGVDAGRCPRCDVGRIERRPLGVRPDPPQWDTS